MGFLSCYLHLDGFRDFLAAPSENSPCFSHVDSASFHWCFGGKGWKTRGQNRDSGFGKKPAAGMRMNSGGRVRHERGGEAEAPGPQAETPGDESKTLVWPLSPPSFLLALPPRSEMSFFRTSYIVNPSEEFKVVWQRLAGSPIWSAILEICSGTVEAIIYLKASSIGPEVISVLLEGRDIDGAGAKTSGNVREYRGGMKDRVSAARLSPSSSGRHLAADESHFMPMSSPLHSASGAAE
ncbi:hypothetical protein DBV15_01233 [Temnothorax longispinosus]|uniref:Uncharacterized protein n=1 Tax=Temnothorax longispinosus TaxID=300112 RepID=A0A4S2KJE3_9HYME|nr:hypothetical protein DBV15_01233 [Temnothorax longispinosus]